MDKVRIGVIGCGSIAQIMHIPHLKEIEGYELKSICDISPKLVERIGDQYNIKERYTDFRDLLNSNVDAVLISTSLGHAEISIEAARAGKHILVEKPMCVNLREAIEMIESAKKNEVRLMVAYMKRYDPGYIYAQKLVSEMREIKLIRLHNAIGPNQTFVDDICDISKSSDVPENVKYEARKRYLDSVKEALGNVPDHVKSAYGLMLGASTHDINMLRGFIDTPITVLSTEIWSKGLFYTSIMNCGGEIRCVFDTGLIGIKKFDEEITVFSNNKVVKANFPSPYLKNAPTYVNVWEMESKNYTEKQVVVSYKESFREELMHFYDCVVNDKNPRTDGKEGKRDLELILDMIKAYKN